MLLVQYISKVRRRFYQLVGLFTNNGAELGLAFFSQQKVPPGISQTMLDL